MITIEDEDIHVEPATLNYSQEKSQDFAVDQTARVITMFHPYPLFQMKSKRLRLTLTYLDYREC